MRKILTVVALLIVLLAIGFGVVTWLGHNGGDSSGSSSSETPTATGPEQPADCPAVEFISAPGTWESAANDDPIAPTANSQSFMLNITRPLQDRFDPARLKVWTLPYTAQFKNINALGEMSYDESRQEGIDKLNAELTETHNKCPSTQFILSGFSQGAVIVGDIVSDIGNDRGAIPADRVLGAAVIADGRREPGRGIVPGTHVAGVGAEITLHPFNALIQPIVPSATMRGTRAGGFGSLNDRTMDLCAPDDAVCDAPLNAVNALDRAQAMIQANGVHAWYAANEYVVPGTTADKWVVQWATDLINSV